MTDGIKTFAIACLLSSSAAHAAPVVSLLMDTQYFCGACRGAYNHDQFKGVVQSVFPDVEMIAVQGTERGRYG